MDLPENELYLKTLCQHLTELERKVHRSLICLTRTIPAFLRERLNLSLGMTLVVEMGEHGGVRLRVQSQPSILVEKDGLLVARVTALSNLINVTRLERERRVFDLLQRTGL